MNYEQELLRKIHDKMEYVPVLKVTVLRDTELIKELGYFVAGLHYDSAEEME